MSSYAYFEKPAGDGWNVIADEPDRCVWIRQVAPGVHEQVTQTCHDATLDRNKELYNDSDHQRWGDGKIIGSIPLSHYFSSGLAEARKQQDTQYIKRFWNDPDNRNFRTFKGNI